ncbi:Leucine-rich repeat receptor-like serine/threonine-protein kinase [Heracleum sosnowskyi]|uniref:Leucine-rich repeat receptor-like serine/threonine-protein kinase n=1 Tax=Heracleum sosnowskyi TaxID=360622 RepID=A0AAD8M4C6_9APIA|nr:Leucine-rich repeat receptor-like serine/threonine-protein kinase [Heracleum sosnowskyi]
MWICISFFLQCIIIIPLSVNAFPDPKGLLLNCGSTTEVVEENGLKYVPDHDYVSVGNITTIQKPGLMPRLTSLRYFNDTVTRKFCYTLPVIKGHKFLVRTTYYYGGFDGGKEPPVFDQIIDGTLWGIVNTTEDYANDLTSYYEIVVMAPSNSLSICLARNGHTVSYPFISALEVLLLSNSVYNFTAFSTYALTTIARTSFGPGPDIISYPDDPFNRYWQPFFDKNVVEESHTNVTPSEFWNSPPAKAFQSALTSSRGSTLAVRWTQYNLPTAHYYVALYFQDTRTASPDHWRIFNVSINNEPFYDDLNVTTRGVAVYNTEMPLQGKIEISLTPRKDMSVGPVISAGEILRLLPINRRTLLGDVMVMEEFVKSLDNLPPDWIGDPCLPKAQSWTGVTCTGGEEVRILTLNLTSYGISGTLPKDIAKLSAVSSMWFADNKISGPIPDMTSMDSLESLHLEDNQFEGSIPQSLGQLPKLQELFIQNNQLSGTIPNSLTRRNDINMQTSGNRLITEAM